MRVISESKDYYDCIQAMGQDRSIVYVRKEKEVYVSKNWPFPPYGIDSSLNKVGIQQFIIGFCGKIYPMIKLTCDPPVPNEKQIVAFCFTVDDVSAFMKAHLSNKYYKIYMGNSEIPRRWRWQWQWGRTQEQVSKFIEQCKSQQNDFFEMFIEEHCPIFVVYSRNWKDYTITYNALLKPYGFYRLFDPSQAFQEIAMFMGNMAVPEKDMPVINDEMKIHSRGFDKWSFRTPPAGQSNK